MVYYLGSDSEAPVTPPWSKDSPAFHTMKLTDEENECVKTHLPHLHLVYVGSHQGCGCGFRSYRDGLLMDGDAADSDVAADHAALAAYLQALPSSARSIQVLACWDGDEALPLESYRDFSIGDVLDPSFAFRERELLTLTR